MSAVAFIRSNRRAAATWHIARYEPSGYGVRSFCGRTWDEGDYVATQLLPPYVCQTCRRIEQAAA